MTPPRRRGAPSLLRVRIGILAAGLALLAGIGLLGADGVRTTQREQTLKHQAVAERVFDELERELTELVKQEEARPFLHWRHLVVPDEQVVGSSIVTSPLAPLPAEDHVIGYFQYNPDGSLVSPHTLAGDEAARYGLELSNPVGNDVRVDELAILTVDVAGWTQESVAEPLTAPVVAPAPAARPLPKPAAKPIATPVLGVEGAPEPKPVPAPVAKPAGKPIIPTNIEIPEGEWQFSLNNASSPRQGRSEQHIQAPIAQLDNFGVPANRVQSAAEPGALLSIEPAIEPAPEPLDAAVPEPVVAVVPEPVAAVPAPAAIALPPPAVTPSPPDPIDLDRPTDVVISPMEVRPGPDDTVVFSRTVRIEGNTWVQGVAYRRGPLQQWIATRALGDSEPLTYLELDWHGPGNPDATYRFAHPFAPPFDDWQLTVSLASLSSSGLDPAHAVLLLTLLAALAGLLGLGSAYRTAAASVAYAQQRESFVAAVTHELKTPLTAIQMYAEMLRGGMVFDETKRQRYYGTIHDEAGRLGRLVDDVLAFSRLDRGAQRRVFATGTVGDAIEVACAVVQPRLDAASRPLHRDVSPEAAAIRIDRDGLVHVLTNLLDNAVKFGGDAPVSLTAEASASGVTVVVRDGGRGIPRALQRAMFEPFVRGEDEATRETQGTGIGLSLVAALVAQAGGAVTAKNGGAGGLEVTVRLPTAAEAPGPTA